MTFIRQVLSKIFEILVVYLKLLILAIVLYTIIYCYLKYIDGSPFADVEINETIDASHPARHYDL